MGKSALDSKVLILMALLVELSGWFILFFCFISFIGLRDSIPHSPAKHHLLHKGIRHHGREESHLHAHLVMIVQIVQLGMAILTGGGNDLCARLLNLIYLHL